MAGNKDLNKAAQAKKDEFYTQLTDIEKEMRYYRAFFKDKIVFCNCDDPFESNFFKYFAMNFNSLGLKKLIATCYATSPIVYTQLSMFGDEAVVGQESTKKKPYRIEITEVTDENEDGRIDLADVEVLLRNRKNALTLLKGDGDFRSAECIELLKQADVVVTNPPFSLFREFIVQLIEYEKYFIIIGNMNAIHYKEVFPLIKDNRLWIGPSIHSGDRKFNVPDDYPLNAAGCGIDADGKKFIRVKGVRWFTNVDIEQRHEEMVLYKPYSSEEYPKYLNYNAIEVSCVADIPCNYYDEMGVPDTFMDKYNPDQFEIIGLAEGELGKMIGISANLSDDECKTLIKECKSFRRGNPIFRAKDGKLHKPYARIIIRRKQVNPNEN